MTTHTSKIGNMEIELMVDGSGIIVAVSGDPRGAHYIGQRYSVFKHRQQLKQIRCLNVRNAEAEAE